MLLLEILRMIYTVESLWLWNNCFSIINDKRAMSFINHCPFGLLL